MTKKIMSSKHLADLQKSMQKSSNSVIYAPLSKSVCAAMLAGAMVLGGGVFISPAPAYADGYVSPDGNNIYYGYKSDADYSKDRFKIEVHYYNNPQDAENDDVSKQDPLGKYVHVKYIANLNKDGKTFDNWAFRPMWWYGVPKGLQNVHDIRYGRFEELTSGGSKHITPGARKDSDKSIRFLDTPKDWKGISNFYITDPSKLTSMNGLKTLLGIDDGNNKGYDNKGNTAGNWKDFYDASKGMQSMFVDWESAGKRYYEMTYVAELTDEAWKQRDVKPLHFAAGVYRFAGNWHIATGQVHRAPKIADSLKVKYPTQTPVANVKSLTSEEQGKVKAEINKANTSTPHFSDLLDGTAGIEVAADGTATLKFKDNTTLTMPGNLLVMEQKRDRDLYPPTYPAPVPAVDPDKPNAEEQKAIIKAIKDANKSNKNFTEHVNLEGTDTFTFDDSGKQLKIKYKDNSELAIPYSSLVYQGAKISDWAPYVVPDAITVDNLTNISDAEVTTIKKAFDDANTGLDVYTNAKKKDSASYLTIDKNTGNATIKWEDGSTTTIAAWQFLKEKPKTTPSPEPQPPVPTPAAEKEFIVEAPATQTNVNFDPFKMNEADLTNPTNVLTLNGAKALYIGEKGKDAKDSTKKVNINSVEYSVKDGVGYVTFKANGYKDAKYPMSVFFKQKANTQTPQTPSTETKTETDEDNPGNTFTYKVTKTEIEGNTPTAPDAVKALKQFVKDNYDNVTDSDLQSVTSDVAVKTTWTPKAGTKNMGAYGAKAPNDGPMTSFSIDTTNGFAITVHGHPWDPDADNGADWDSAREMPLFTIKPSDLYVKKGGSQQQDNTLGKLKQQAKDLLKKRKGAPDNLTDKDLKKAGIADPANLNDSSKGIDKMDEKALRDLIQKLTDAKHYDRKYNTPTVEVDNPDNLTADNFKAAVKAFLEANYDNATDVNVTSTSDFTLPTNLTPKKDTVYMEVGAYGVTKIKSVSKDGIVVVDGDGKTTFTVKPTYKKKAAPEPAPSDDELNELRKQAKEIIDRNPNLTPEQKTKFKGDIDGAKDKPAILKILNDAKNQGNTNKTNPDVQQIINKNKNGGDEKKQHELDAAKEAAKKAIENLPNLSDDEKKDLKGKVDKANSIDGTNGVNSVVDEAKKLSELNTAKKEAKEAKLYFLDHGKGADADSSDSNHADDAALNELLGTKPAEDSTLKALADKLKKDANATAAEIRDALEAAKRQNGINEQAAKRAATAKLDALEQSLDDAYNKLSDTDKTAVNAQYTAAKDAITQAKTAVTNATKPSELLNAINGVNDSLTTANKAVKEKIDTEHKNNKKDNDHNSDPDALKEEKKKAKEEIDNIPGLTEDEKNDYKKKIDDSTHSGDPETFVNQAKKHKKIKDALDKLDKDFNHLNNAQKEAFKKIIEDTDASDHKNADGTTSDDIDDALANAANTDNAMARLGELEKKANALKTTDKYTGANVDPTKKAAFDKVLQSVDDLLNKEKGDSKGAPEVNDLYTDLLNKMRDLDSKAQSAGLKTDALKNEIDSDNKLKPSETDPKTPGDSVYTTASSEKKDAFDKALNEAQTVLNGAASADISTADKEATEQNEIDAALDKLIKARLALDGVDTTKLQTEIDNAPATTSSDAYKYDSQEKQNNYNKALQDAKDLIDKLTGKKQAAQGEEDVTTKTQAEKQKLVDDALAKLKAAEAALKGKKPVEPTPTPTPTPSVDKSHLQQGIDNGSDVHNSDEYNNAPSDKKQAYDHALDHANEVNNNPNATQDQVNQAAEDLKKAEHDLKPTPSPLPSPVPGGAGFGVNDNAPTTVDKGELNVQIDSAEADSQPGNAGNGNAGAGNAGNANAGAGANSGNASNANNAANGANSAAVNAAVENSPAVKQADAQVSKAQAALDAALAEAKKVAADPNATQAQVDAAAQKLSAARKALASAKAHAAEVRASVRAQVLKSGVSKLSKTGSNVSVIGLLATVAAAGAAFFVSKRRGISRHSNN